MRRACSIVCALAFGAILTGSASAGKTDGVSWFLDGKPAPTTIKATAGQGLGTAVTPYLTVTARRRGHPTEPLNGIACLYKRPPGGLKGGPRTFNDCGKVPGVDVCNMKPTVSAEISGESFGCIIAGSATKPGTFHFRLLTFWTDLQKDPSGHTMGYDVRTFTFVVN